MQHKIAIEGNIGSGKTTQLDLLSGTCRVFREPVHLWPLEEFYQDPQGKAFLMQTSVLASFKDQGPGIYERSTLASKIVFTKFDTESEKMSYEMLYDRLGWNPDYWIFLESDPERCYQKVRGRRGPGDSYVTVSYLKDIEKRYKKMYELVKDRAFVVNADRPVEEVYKTIKYIIDGCIGNTSGVSVNSPA